MDALLHDPVAAGAEIRARALEEGFDAVGIVAPEGVGDAGDRLRDFVGRGWHGDMAWLAAKADLRAHPRSLWPRSSRSSWSA